MKDLFKKSFSASNRYNLFIIKCTQNQIPDLIKELKEIETLSLGKELSIQIFNNQSKHLTIQVQEYLNQLIEENAREVFKGKTKIIAIYNIGILFEPAIQLNTEKILTELSKMYGIILLWDSEIDDGPVLHWGKQKENYKIDLSDIKPQIIDKTL